MLNTSFLALWSYCSYKSVICTDGYPSSTMWLLPCISLVHGNARIPGNFLYQGISWSAGMCSSYGTNMWNFAIKMKTPRSNKVVSNRKGEIIWSSPEPQISSTCNNNFNTSIIVMPYKLIPEIIYKIYQHNKNHTIIPSEIVFITVWDQYIFVKSYLDLC